MQGSFAYKVHLPQFEGPFDLLYHLVRRSQLDIRQISMAEIVDQYLSYLRQMQAFNLEITSEFLVMAAILLRLKSRALLPLPEPSLEEEAEDFLEIDSQEELLRRLEAYRVFKQAAGYLQEREKACRFYFFRKDQGVKLSLPRLQSPSLVNREWEVFAQVVAAMEGQAAAREPVYSVRPERFSVIRWARKLLQKVKATKGGLEFLRFTLGFTPGDRASLFYALLELVRRGKVVAFQDVTFGPLVVLEKEKTDGVE